MKTVPFEQAKEELKQIVASANKDNQQFRISTSVGNAVLLSEETYENLLITLELLSTPGLIDGLEQIQAIEEVTF